jgi:pyruvate dehydrogenase kinase 2/3/4
MLSRVRGAARLPSVLLPLPTSIRAQAYATATTATTSSATSVPPPWRPASILDDWVQREARPISLRQLTFFGRTLTESRLISSANYVRTELPTRLAHRLRNMQTLPYSALTNSHISFVYELYYTAFERLRKVPEVTSVDDNDRFCKVVQSCLKEHLSVIPRLAMGVIEIQNAISGEECDRFMTTLLRSRISRRVIAEQHLALTETFHAPWHFPEAGKSLTAPEDDFVGEIFLRCNAKEIVEQCAETARSLMSQAYGPEVTIPEVVVKGHLETTFPYIPSHIEYMIGELLRNSMQAIIERPGTQSPPIEVLICEAAQHVIIRVSDQGGGIERDILPYLWSFAKGPRRQARLENLERVPKLAGTMQELRFADPDLAAEVERDASSEVGKRHNSSDPKHRTTSSLTALSGRQPDLRLGMGLPLSRIYAEYWAGTLEIHSLEGYGVDAFLQISKLGNRNEVLSTRAAMDAV